MEVTVDERESDEFVVRLSGELDLATTPMLSQAISEVLARGQVAALVVDLAEVSFLDSSGMRALLQARHAAQERNASFALRRPSPQVAKVLRIAALDQVLTIEEGDATPPDSHGVTR